ncbi:hypothetical protein V5O48_001025 [Marasmius crinis-equi]|uniref:Uncharacterized protein n=1 Tax=Marasmius crinis-equi TaxID=585013 RepID=A0ABR3FZZ1_9AGAR
MALAILLFLPSFPFSASFLTKRERAIAQARVNRDHKPQSHGGMTGWQGFKAVITDVNCWMFMTIYASFNVGVATISYFLPTLIKELGFTSINAQGLTVAPYAVGWFMVFFQAWHSDRTKDRGYHIMLSSSISFIGYLILALCADKSVGASYFALFLVVGGNYSLFPLELGGELSVADLKEGRWNRIRRFDFELCFDVYFDPETQFRKGHGISAGCLLLSFLTALLLKMRLLGLNKRNAKRLASMGQEAQVDSGEMTEIMDTDPRYLFPT